jgi:hypothetical protein
MSARALKARLNAAPANNARRHSGLNRAFSAAFLGRTIFLARCPRLVMNAAPLALAARWQDALWLQTHLLRIFSWDPTAQVIR